MESNFDLAAQFPNRIDSELINKLGIRSKHIIDPNVKGSELAASAAKVLFAETGIDKEEIDALIYCSVHHDYITPATSCVLQHELRLRRGIMAFDLTHGCSGYLYGLALARSIIDSLGVKNVLFLTASALTKYIDTTNVGLRAIFGDAGSATIVSAQKGAGGRVGDFVLGTDGAGFQKLIIRDGLEAHPLSHTSNAERRDQFGNIHTDAGMFMDGQSVFMFVLKHVPQIIDDTLAKNGLKRDDIDLYILHQANEFTLEALRKKMGIETGRFFYSMAETGNTVQATVPIALKEAMAKGKIEAGSKVLLAGFGTGLSWGATVISF